MTFTPLESHGIYAGDAINTKYQLLTEGGVKAPSFLTGFDLGDVFAIKKKSFRSPILLP